MAENTDGLIPGARVCFLLPGDYLGFGTWTKEYRLLGDGLLVSVTPGVEGTVLWSVLPGYGGVRRLSVIPLRNLVLRPPGNFTTETVTVG